MLAWQSFPMHDARGPVGKLSLWFAGGLAVGLLPALGSYWLECAALRPGQCLCSAPRAFPFSPLLCRQEASWASDPRAFPEGF